MKIGKPAGKAARRPGTAALAKLEDRKDRPKDPDQGRRAGQRGGIGVQEQEENGRNTIGQKKAGQKMEDDHKPQLIEQTAKRFKAVQATSAGMAIAAGIGILIARANEWPVLVWCFCVIASVGVLAYFGARILAWWHHG